MRNAEIQTVGYHVEATAEFLKSPLRAIIDGANEIRQRLQSSEVEILNHPLCEELRAEGLTDYIAWPLDHTLGKRHLVTFATDAPRGFDDDHFAVLAEILPALALVSEIRLKNQLARTLLETYVGPHASEKILAGATTRGSGVTVDAAILICDLRNFTALSNFRSRDEVIDILNGYFDAMTEPIVRNGGEILKFMGDGLLAIFPLSNPTACSDLLRAIGEAQTALAGLNDRNLSAGRDALGYGIGVHVGDVMYGNIGSRNRLDFTVIGPAVNIASRLENLTKEVKRSVLFSKAFVEKAGCESKLEDVGSYSLRGLSEPITAYAFSTREVAGNQAG
jgi:adenylate cyclase